MSPPPDAEPEQDQELDRLRRCLAVLLEVLGGTRDGPTALAERFEVAPSTLRRDLSALRKTTGWPLEWDYRGKRWLPGGAVPLLQLPPGATAALCAFAEHLSARDSDEVRGVGTALTSALLAHLDEGASALIERLSRGRSPQVLPVVERALRERIRLRLTYRSLRRGGEHTLLVDPMRLRYVPPHLYLEAFNLDERAVRLQRIDRVVRVEALGVSLPEGTLPARAHADRRNDVGAWTGEPVIEVRCHVDARIADLVDEEPPCEDHTWTTQPGSEVRVLTARIAHRFGFLTWAQRWLDGLTIVDPPELADEMRARLEAARARY